MPPFLGAGCEPGILPNFPGQGGRRAASDVQLSQLY